MTLAPLAFKCPQCGSADVIYSCSPSCCFNHVCSQCYSTFEPETERVGEYAGDAGPLPELDPAGPTAPCARCGEHQLFTVSDPSVPPGQVFCAACHALLTVRLTPLGSDPA